MKPWPEALRKLCPLSPVPVDAHPERPWWRHRDGRGIRAADSTRIDVGALGRSVSSTFIPVGVSFAPLQYGYPLALLCADIDAKMPLPHPGFRAGQVWADETGTTVVVTRMAQGIPWFENGRGSGYIAEYPYLVADPCCPHLAPWAPPETP